MIPLQTLLRRSLKDGDIEPILRKLVHLCQQLPRPGDDFLLEVVTEGPVTQHLKHGVVIGVVSHSGEIVVLTAHAQALLRVGYPRIFPRGIPEDDVLKLIHPRIGKHKGRIPLQDHRSGGNDMMSSLCKEVKVHLTDFINRFHIY